MEVESDGRAYMRFGDGVRAKQPHAESAFTATYRVGNGLAGNVGRRAIAHLVADSSASSDLVGRVMNVNNFLVASGGIEPEPLSDVRLYAPRAFRQQQRCVTAEDYAAIAKRHPEVQNAAALLRWSGSWYTAVLIIERRNNKPLDAAFQKSLLEFMEPYRVVGYDITIRAPRFVALDIALTVHVASTHFASTVKQALIETFSAVDLPNGQRGFFHPDHFTFGEPVYLSKIVAHAVKVAGVVWVQATRYQRWGASRQEELEAGIIDLNPLEIAQLNNNQPAGPQNGRLVFEMKGGR
jgi:predicted phage baseplate assembly protein